jgi:hypothetical protein
MATGLSEWRIVPGPYWPWSEASVSTRLATGWGGVAQASGLCGNDPSSGAWRPSLLRSGADVLPVLPPLQRVHIERVACTDPAAYGLQLARWDCRSLQGVVVEQAIVGSIHETTVARILAHASLQPHRRR